MRAKFSKWLAGLQRQAHGAKLDWLSVNSLAFRLFATAAVLSLMVLPLLGYILLSHHRHTVEQLFDQQLSDHITLLNINMDKLIKEHRDPENHNEAKISTNPTFLAPASGWYWQISPLGEGCGAQILSPSLTSEVMKRPVRTAENRQKTLFLYMTGPFGESLRVTEQIIVNELEKNTKCQRYSVMVSGNAKIMQKKVADFSRTLFVSLTILGLGLAFASLVQVHYGLAPLGEMRRELADIRSGKTDRLHGEFPAEIMPLRDELNSLIESNHDIVERARTHVGNLAHALETPLSVITNETRAENSALAKKLTQQAEVMRNQIAHHLDRARMVARVNMIGSVTEVLEAVKPLVRVLNRINEDKGVEITLEMQGAGLQFQGEKQDLEEMLGNLLENACNWAHHDVALDIESVADTSFPNGQAVRFRVMDDGPGLPADQLEAVIRRGKRLDESKPGSGLGLSIVAELAELYKGRLYLENMADGGLCSVLVLPIVLPAAFKG